MSKLNWNNLENKISEATLSVVQDVFQFEKMTPVQVYKFFVSFNGNLYFNYNFLVCHHSTIAFVQRCCSRGGYGLR